MATFTNAPAVNADISSYGTASGDTTLFNVAANSYVVCTVSATTQGIYLAGSTLTGGTYTSGYLIPAGSIVYNIHMGPGSRLVAVSGCVYKVSGVQFTNQA